MLLLTFLGAKKNYSINLVQKKRAPRINLDDEKIIHYVFMVSFFKFPSLARLGF